jgi:peptidoglycan/xylan/chitin deacetylase (PgdA/CDA1 family)
MTILMYHSISDDLTRDRFALSPRRFAAQMAWLAANEFRGVSVREAMAASPNRHQRTVVLTFDDGFLDTYLRAFPILVQHGFAATVFLPTGHVGGMNEWEDGAVATKPLMGWDQIAEMAAAGIEFGSHTVSHLDLRNVRQNTIMNELAESKEVIEHKLGANVLSFAYPYGYFRPDMPEMLAETGYEYGLLAATYGRNTPATGPYQLHRLPIWGGDSLPQFVAKLRGWYWWRYYTSNIRCELNWALKKCWTRG